LLELEQSFITSEKEENRKSGIGKTCHYNLLLKCAEGSKVIIIFGATMNDWKKRLNIYDIISQVLNDYKFITTICHYLPVYFVLCKNLRAIPMENKVSNRITKTGIRSKRN